MHNPPKKKMIILVGRNPKNMRGGASTWILNVDSFFRKDFEIDYLIIPEKWLNITFIPDRIKATVQTLYVLITKHKKWDIYLSHSPELSYYATLFSKNVVHIAHGNTNPVSNPTFRWGKIFYVVFEFFNAQVEKKAKLLYTVGEKKTGYKNINQPIHHALKPLSFKEKKGLIFAGRLEKIKNIDLIISAFVLLPPEVQREHNLLIYGMGTQRKYLKGLIEKLKVDGSVFLKGHVNNKNLISIINKSALLVMASNFEGFPMVIAEALTVGTPVLSTDVGSISSAVKSGYNGYVISKKTEPKFYAQKIEEILKSSEHYCKNALQSSSIFKADEVYSQIKADLDYHFQKS
jgi:glycosyltransferase involved in cell wall biosynthesis